MSRSKLLFLEKNNNSVMVPMPISWTDFDIISYKYDNIWDRCVFQHCRSKVNVTDAILGKNLVKVLLLFCELILINLHTNVNCDNI